MPLIAPLLALLLAAGQSAPPTATPDIQGVPVQTEHAVGCPNAHAHHHHCPGNP